MVGLGVPLAEKYGFIDLTYISTFEDPITFTVLVHLVAIRRSREIKPSYSLDSSIVALPKFAQTRSEPEFSLAT
jgi:hypothetical protein